jgi:hypothetical protein
MVPNVGLSSISLQRIKLREALTHLSRPVSSGTTDTRVPGNNPFLRSSSAWDLFGVGARFDRFAVLSYNFNSRNTLSGSEVLVSMLGNLSMNARIALNHLHSAGYLSALKTLVAPSVSVSLSTPAVRLARPLPAAILLAHSSW